MGTGEVSEGPPGKQTRNKEVLFFSFSSNWKQTRESLLRLKYAKSWQQEKTTYDVFNIHGEYFSKNLEEECKTSFTGELLINSGTMDSYWALGESGSPSLQHQSGNCHLSCKSMLPITTHQTTCSCAA